MELCINPKNLYFDKSLTVTLHHFQTVSEYLIITAFKLISYFIGQSRKVANHPFLPSSFPSNSEEWLEKMVHVALFLPVGPESYMFIHKTPCDDVVAEFGGIWDAVQYT